MVCSQVELVGGASDAGRPLVKDMSVDLRRADVAVAEEFLHRADVAAGLEQVRGERVQQGLTRAGFWDLGAPERKSSALGAWFWVEPATWPSTAREVKNRVTSGPPISRGWRRVKAPSGDARYEIG